MGLIDKIKAMDPDDVLAYQTIKLVKIRDRRLGAIHHLLQIGIFIYIVVYTIIIQKRYLKSELPNGSFRATVRQPNQWIDASTIPYCAQMQTSYNNFTNYNCTYYLGLDLTYPPAMMDSILIGTRIKDTTFPINSACTTPTEAPTTQACAANPSSKPTISNELRYYSAGIENYTIYIEHAIFGRQNRITVTNKDCLGKLHYANKKVKPANDADIQKNLTDFAIKKANIGDIFSISTLITAANTPSLDALSGVDVTKPQTLRYDGALIMMVVEYSNKGYSTTKLKYDYYAYRIPGVSVVAQEPSRFGSTAYTQRSWYGIRVIFILAGTIGKFDFPSLLTALVSGMVLVKAAATVVDLLLLYIMPDKALYAKHKYEVTDDFSDVRAQKNKEVSLTQVSAADSK